MLTNAQMLTLKAAIQTSGLNLEDYSAIADWLNALQTDVGWMSSASTRLVDDAPDYSTYDALAAGKRDSWARFLAFDRDFSRAKVRKWITDVWGNATAGSDAEAILQAGTRKVTRAEKLLANTATTTGTVTALRPIFEGTISVYDIGGILSAA